MSDDKATSTTFKVHDVTDKHPRPFRNRTTLNATTSPKDLIKDLLQYEKNNCTEVVQVSEIPTSPSSEILLSRNGFVDTVVDAYNSHSCLVMRPDDIWTVIMTQFSYYMNKNSDQFAETLGGDLTAKRKLEITVPGPLATVKYDDFIKLMTNEIQNHLADTNLKDWILPNFSTTSETDLVTTGAAFLASQKKYFDYQCKINCGIPEVTLEGTVEDWRNIQGRLERLKEFKLERWCEMLEPIIGQFVDAKEGKVDLEFWRKIVECMDTCGSYEVTGWITAFCIFDNEGNYQPSFDHWSRAVTDQWLFIENFRMATGIVEVDLKIIDSAGERNIVMFAGHLTTEVKNEGKTIHPKLGWAVALKGRGDEDAN